MGAARQQRSRKKSRQSPASAGYRVQTPTKRDAGASRALLLAHALLILAAGTWAWWTSFSGVLVLDDMRAIALNPTIRSMRLLEALSPPSASTVSARPVANLSFAINYALAPADVRDAFVAEAALPAERDAVLRNLWGYHFLSLTIHLGAGLLLFGIVRRTLSTARLRSTFGEASTWLACAIAGVWVVHPLQTESVTYIVQRVESLAGLFYLLTLYCAIRAFETSRTEGASQFRAWAIGAVAACAAGMATKEIMVTAPITVWLWERVFGDQDSRRSRWLLPGAVAATWLILAILVFYEHRSPSISLEPGTVWRYLFTQASVVIHYVRLALVPQPLVFLYTWFIEPSASAVVPQMVVIGTLVALTIVGCVKRHPLGFLGAWFLLILAPTSSFLPIVTEVAAEHRMYLPLAAVVGAVVLGCYMLAGPVLQRFVVDPVARRRAGFVTGAALAGLAVLLLGGLTRARNRDYWSEEALWQDTVRKQPDNYRARIGYGAALMHARRMAEAEAQFRAAVAIAPADPNAQSRLGSALAAQGRTDEAIVHFERSLALRPDDAATNRLAGEAHAARHQDALAVARLGRAADVMKDDPMLLAHLAAILADSNDPSVRDGLRAVALAERAVALTSGREPHVLDVLAVAQASVGRFADAASNAEAALGLARQQGNQQLITELEYRVAAYAARR